MNDPNEIILNISIEKDAFMEESEEKKDEITLSEANKFNNLLLHLKENLSKRFYSRICEVIRRTKVFSLAKATFLI